MVWKYSRGCGNFQFIFISIFGEIFSETHFQVFVSGISKNFQEFIIIKIIINNLFPLFPPGFYPG
jgi:hypothetical protein